MGQEPGRDYRRLRRQFGDGRLYDLGGVFALLLGLVALFAVVLWLIVGGVLAMINHRDHYATDPIAIDIGAVGYTVPGNYVSVVPQGRPGGHQFAEIRVLRQGFEPRTEENRADWKTWDADGRLVGEQNPLNTVSIRISNLDLLGVRLLERHTRDGAYPAETAGYGLIRYAGGLLDTYDRTFLVSGEDYRTAEGGPAVIVCDPSIGGMPELYDVTMNCVGGYLAPDGAWIRYAYYSNDIADWRRIDEQVRALVNSFTRTQPAPG